MKRLPPGSKIFQTWHGRRSIQKNKFPFGKKFKFPTEFELKIQEANHYKTTPPIAMYT
jgi:hypothetical protein